MALIMMQVAPLHVHVYNHDHDIQDHLISTENLSPGDHTHLNQVHLSYSSSSVDHSHEVVSEIDIVSEGLLKSLSFGLLLIAILTAIIIVFLVPSVCTRIVWRRNENFLPLFRHHVICPPLRAPPL